MSGLIPDWMVSAGLTAALIVQFELRFASVTVLATVGRICCGLRAVRVTAVAAGGLACRDCTGFVALLLAALGTYFHIHYG